MLVCVVGVEDQVDGQGARCLPLDAFADFGDRDQPDRSIVITKIPVITIRRSTRSRWAETRRFEEGQELGVRWRGMQLPITVPSRTLSAAKRVVVPCRT